MKNKITIAIVALMVAALAAPAVIAEGNIGYSASVGSAANVVVASSDAVFGSVAAGTSYTKSPSITLTNSGNAVGTVTAEFTTDYSGIYGMVSASNDVILAEHLTIDGQALNNDGSTDALSPVPAHDGTNDGTVSYDAVLTVPLGQETGTYNGNVLLTFGTA